jgi:hypothetical protein
VTNDMTTDMQQYVRAAVQTRRGLKLSSIAEMLRNMGAELDDTTAAHEVVWNARRALQASFESDWKGAPNERKYTDGIASQYGATPRTFGSFYMPTYLRDISVGVSPSLVSTQEGPAGVIQGSASLRSRCSVIGPIGRGGALRVGRLNTLPNVTVLTDELAPATEITPATGAGTVTPRGVSTYHEVSRNFALQSEGGARATTEVVVNAMNTHQTAQIVVGSGAGGNVTGLVNDAAVTTVSGTTLAWATVCARMEAVEAVAGDPAGLAWAVSAPAATILRQRATSTGGEPILRDGKIGGHPCIVFGGTTSAVAVFGRWQDLLICEWLPIEVMVNPYAQFQSAVIGVRAMLYWDALAMVPAHFTCINNIT